MDDHSQRGSVRERRVAFSFFSGGAAKAINIAVTFLSVPLVYESLALEQFGIWMTLTAIATALQFADLGVGNGLLNEVAAANARDDRLRARQAVSSGTFVLIGVGGLILISYSLLFSFINWRSFFNVSSNLVANEAAAAVTVMICALALSLPLVTAQRIQMGYQQGFHAHYWTSLGAVLSLVAVTVGAAIDAPLPFFVFASVGGPLVAAALSCFYEFSVARPWLFPRPRYVDLLTSKRLLKAGLIWSVFQLAAFVGVGLDNIIVSHLFGAEDVGTYAVMTRLMTSLLIGQLLSAPLWPAYAEAIERKDLDWVSKTYRRSRKIFAGIGVVSGFLIYFGSVDVVRLWVGPELAPSEMMIFGFAVWVFVANFFGGISALMSNQRFLVPLTVLTLTASIISLILKLTVSPFIGVDFVVWCTAIGYGLTLIPGMIFANRIMSGKALNESFLFAKPKK